MPTPLSLSASCSDLHSGVLNLFPGSDAVGLIQGRVLTCGGGVGSEGAGSARRGSCAPKPDASGFSVPTMDAIQTDLCHSLAYHRALICALQTVFVSISLGDVQKLSVPVLDGHK